MRPSSRIELAIRTFSSHQIQQLERGNEPDDNVDPTELSELTRRYLRDAFREVAAVQKSLSSNEVHFMLTAKRTRHWAVTLLEMGTLASFTRHNVSPTWRDAVVGSVLLGAASGARGQLGVATVVARSDPSLPGIFRQPWTRRLLVAAAAGELVVDKLPTTPSRLELAGIAGRLTLGALAAGLFARTRRAPWLPAAALGAASAIVAAKIGHDVRARLAQHVPDPAVAVVEDGVAFGLAVAGASR